MSYATSHHTNHSINPHVAAHMTAVVGCNQSFATAKNPALYKHKHSMIAVCVVALGLGLVGCASKSQNNRQSNATIVNYNGIPGRYQVKSGDTVSKIANRYGLNWRDVSALNRLDANHTIYVGQWLTLHTHTQSSGRNRAPVSSARTSSIPTSTATSSGTHPSTPQASGQSTSVALAASGRIPTASITKRPVSIGSGLLRFRYPVNKENPVARRFGTPTAVGMTEGIFFSGKEGDAIMSAGSGSVIHADVNVAAKDRPMVIIEHENGYVSSYYDVRNIQVRTGDQVISGQRLGSMIAQTSSGLALFEFRIAKSGSYIDPVSVLH